MKKKKVMQINSKLLIGQTEWCALPRLGIPAIKARVDTGAKTSALHAFNIKLFYIKEKKYVRFDIHPLQANNELSKRCKALVVDERFIMSSNGHKEHRFVIATPMKIGNQQWNIELTLSNRDPLTFRMLLGREALGHSVLIDPSLKCRQGKIPSEKLLELYSE